MEEEEIRRRFGLMYADLRKEDEYYSLKPLLAHYTSTQVLESILKNGELWFSNPLLMNDVEEVRFGMNESLQQFMTHQGVQTACKNPRRFDALARAYQSYYNQFAEDHVLNTYLFCLSLHDASDVDGRLSMWRGYGGNGNGVAIVFDTSKLAPDDNGPLIIAKVHYANRDQRRGWITDKLLQFSSILQDIELPEVNLPSAAYYLFERFKLFSIFSKHKGFDEEQEWRIAYLPGRDKTNLFSDMMGYNISVRGIEPKLKLKVDEVVKKLESAISFNDLIHSIILGPSISTPLSKVAIDKMLTQLGKTDLKTRVTASTIPYRSSS
jgi:Protein of unknown function (DUF2971)